MDNSRYLISKIEEHIASKYGENNSIRLQFVSVLDNDPKTNEPNITVYAIKRTKKGGLKIKKVAIEYINTAYLSDDLYYTNMSGWVVVFDGERKSVCYYIYTAQNTFYETDQQPKFHAVNLFTAKELEEHFSSVVNYLKLDMLDTRIEPITLLRAYKNDHTAEMLTKCGVQYLVENCKGFNRLTKHSQKKFINWIRNNTEFIERYKPCFSFIQRAIKLNLSGADLMEKIRCDYNALQLKRKPINNLNDKLVREITRFILKQDCDISTYCDYLQFSLEVGRNINDRGVLFPSNIIEQHDHLQKVVSKEKNKKLNVKLSDIKEMLKKYEMNYKGLKIVIPNSQEDLIDWGNKLHNCVGVLSYGEKMSNGKCIILGVFYEGQPLECCELCIYPSSKKLQIAQLRGDHNQDSIRHNDALKLVEKFIHKYKPQRVVGECI